MPNFHSLKIEQIFSELKTSENGLTDKEAGRRLKKRGPNELPKKKPLGKLAVFLNQFKNILIYILLIAGIISLVLKDYSDAIVIFAAVILNTIIGFIQENKANNSLNKLREMIVRKALVIRDGNEAEIKSAFLAVGDIIILRAGNIIPADARLLEADNLLINESALTGEAMPAEKNTAILKIGTTLPDRKNMVFAGTIVAKGLGKAVICATGKDTEIGKIASAMEEIKEDPTPLQKRITVFSRYLGIAIILISILIAGAGIIQGRNIMEMFVVAVAVAVSAIPEGLTIAITVILVLGMQRIFKKQALTRKLIAAETLGSTTVICSDKTGTLTEGKMRVSHIVIGEKEFEAKTLGSRQDEMEAKAVSLALQTAMMCNDAVVENPYDELADWRMFGSPTEIALLSAAIQSGLDKEKLLKIEPKIAELPFESESKFMISLHKKTNGSYVLYEKGAPEKIIAKSAYFFHEQKIRRLNNKEKNKLNAVCQRLTEKGLRVVAVATRNLASQHPLTSPPRPTSPASELAGGRASPLLIRRGEKEERWRGGVGSEVNWEEIDRDLTFIGFIAIKDPLRPEAKETIKICRQAGIRPIIITGDHRLTAQAIAGEIGMKTDPENIITGEELDKISDEELENKVKKIDIYARVSPHHKLKIIKALQARGEVVAMTGDGINDSPALKAADIGICLGTGTDIAKEASDIVLLDNNFSTIVAAIKEGRIIFNNIRKVIAYIISDGFSEIILIIGSIIAGAPLAILPAQILWINIINDGFPNFALAFENEEDKVMSEKPIKKSEPIINKKMKIIIFFAGIFNNLIILAIFIYFFKQGAELSYLRTFIFAAISFKSLSALFSLRDINLPIWRVNHSANNFLFFSILASFALLLSAIYFSPLQKILSTVSLRTESWLAIIFISISSMIIIEMAKFFYIIRERVKQN